MFHPWKVIRVPESRNPALWNPESGILNRLKSEIQVPLTQNQKSVPGIRNPGFPHMRRHVTQKKITA